VWDLRSFKDPSDRFTCHKCESAIANTITIFMTIYDNFFQPFFEGQLKFVNRRTGMGHYQKKNLKTPIKTRTLHLSDPYDSMRRSLMDSSALVVPSESAAWRKGAAALGAKTLLLL
jgi:hypothetical protein